jgi:reactive intermediate/imine deaminase
MKSNPKPTASRRYINLPGRPNLPFSDAVLAGNTLYISGRLGFEPGTTKIPADPEQEARYLLDGIKAVLVEAGMTMDELVYVQVYCPDVSLFDRFNAVYRRYFSSDFPARAFLGSGPLLFGARFEIMGIAVANSPQR